MLACVCNVVFLRSSMGLTNFNRSSIDWISVASMDAWIFTDSLDFGFNRIGSYGLGFQDGWTFSFQRIGSMFLVRACFRGLDSVGSSGLRLFQDLRISGFQDSWIPVFSRYRCDDKTKMQRVFD